MSQDNGTSASSSFEPPASRTPTAGTQHLGREPTREVRTSFLPLLPPFPNSFISGGPQCPNGATEEGVSGKN